MQTADVEVRISQQFHALDRDDVNWKSDCDQLEILDVLSTLAANATLPFRIFICSRPERIIEEFFSTTAQEPTIKLFLDSSYEPDADIKRFLESKFADIRRRAGISKAWPGLEAVDRIVDMSSGQFIVPVTIIRWVGSGIPQRQLADVMQLEQVEGDKNPFATLDALYRHILKRAHTPEDDPCLVVKWILCINSAVTPSTRITGARFWRQFLENEEGELSYRLAPITSLLSVPPPNDNSSPMTIYHKSLTDFLSSPNRCGDLYVPETEYDSFVADRIFAVLKCGPHLFSSFVPSLIH